MNTQELRLCYYLNKLKENSRCLDKQVACVVTDIHYNIIASGVNEIIKCDKNCHDKKNRTCEVMHAERVIASHLSSMDRGKIHYALINLFPCQGCQKVLVNWGVKEIVVFGGQHKPQWFPNIRLEPNIYQLLLTNNGLEKQLSVAQGELAELITMISDYFYRKDKNVEMVDMLDEIVDAELMLDQLKLICWNKNNEAYNLLNTIRSQKYERLLIKLANDELG